MKILKKWCLFSFALFSLNNFAQEITAKHIIEKNIQATGGVINWKRLNSTILQGKVILGIKEEYPIKIYQSRPNLTKTIVTVNKKEQVVEGYDGKKGYAMNYATNKLQEYPSYIPESFDTDFIDYEQKGFSAKLLGEEKLGDNEVFKVELTKNVNKTIYYFDKNTYLLLRETKRDEVTNYSDYKKVGQLMMPFKIEGSSSKNNSYTIIINKIEINKVFPENTFKFSK